MRIYLDEKNYNEFLNIMHEEDSKAKSSGPSALKELCDYIRTHCEVKKLPLDKSESNTCRNKPYDSLEDETNKDSLRRENRAKKIFSLRDKQNARKNNLNDLQNRWLTNGDTPYTEQDEDEDVKKYVSLYFSDMSYPDLYARDLSPFSIKEFLNGCLMQSKFATAKLRYTGNTNSWSSLLDTNLPVSETIIVDPYLFVHNKDNNINSTYKLIRHLIDKNSAENFIFICDPPKLTKDGPVPNYENIYTTLHNEHPKCKFLFVLHYTAKENTSESLHDRYIITNNGLYISGHSFVNYYPSEDGKCEARGSVGFSIHSFLDHDNELVLRDIIDNNLSKVLLHSQKGELMGDEFKSTLLKFNEKNIFSVGWAQKLQCVCSKYIDKEFTPTIIQDKETSFVRECIIKEKLKRCDRIKILNIWFNTDSKTKIQFPYIITKYKVIR